MVDTILTCRLFARTPRAGSLNHRYLVAPGMSWPEQELAELASQVDRSPEGHDYIAVTRTVPQPTTGRSATEMLVLTDARLARLDSAARQRVMDKLRAYSDPLEHLVTRGIDWPKGAPLVVETLELGVWQRELDSTLRPLLPPPGSTTPSLQPLRRSKPAPLRSRVIWALGLALALAAVLWHRCLKPRPPKGDGHPPGPPPPPERANQLLDLLARKIEWENTSELRDPSERRAQTLEVFYRWLREKPAPSGPQTQQNDLEYALEKLRLLRKDGGPPPKESFDRVGLVQDERRAQRLGLNRIDPVDLRRAFNTLLELQDFAEKETVTKELIGTGAAPGKLLQKLNRALSTAEVARLRPPPGAQPKFFVDDDVGRAEVLSDILSSPEWRELLGRHSGSSASDSLPDLFAETRQSQKDLRHNVEGWSRHAEDRVQRWYQHLVSFT